MIVIVLFVFLILLLILGVKIVPQQHAFVIERLGKYKKTITAGLNLIIPFIDVVRVNVNLKEQVADFPPQPVITKDNVTMQIDTVVYFKIMDPAAYAYGVENPIMAIENLTATTLRNIIGDMELDETLTSRDKVNGQLCMIIDEATDPWGIKINRVELKNIMPPRAIQESMEKQMKAERERREQILIAEGEKKSAVLKAEGEKESAVLRAEAEYIATVKEAEAHAESIRLHKEAEANGVIMMKKAEAEGVTKLKEAGMTTDQIVKLRSLNALETAADGQATKIIIPSDIQNVAGFAEGIKETL
ncbi:MAG: SPFH/Band 7/PHB domain protein [Lachnospiraceae bacterium]|nr:SPFH/Band 7/PHB domain protein [Lachnospiraceae bacterium]